MDTERYKHECEWPRRGLGGVLRGIDMNLNDPEKDGMLRGIYTNLDAWIPKNQGSLVGSKGSIE